MRVVCALVAMVGVGCGTDGGHGAFEYEASIAWSADDLPNLETVTIDGLPITSGFTYVARFEDYTQAADSIRSVTATTGSGTFTFALGPAGCSGPCVGPYESCGEITSETERWTLAQASSGGLPPGSGPFSFFSNEGSCAWSDGTTDGWGP